MSKRLSVGSEGKQTHIVAEPPKLQEEANDEAKDMGHSDAYKTTQTGDDGYNLIDQLKKMEIGNDNGMESKAALRSDFLEEGMDKKAIKEAKLEGNGKKKEHVGEDDAGDYAEMLKLREQLESDVPQDEDVDADWIKTVAALFKIPENASGTEEVRILTPAERLKQTIIADCFRIDPVVRETFGFSKVNSQEEETCLLGLYKGLLVLLPNPVSVQTVQGWVENNKLAGGIYYAYKSQGGNSGYFKWFKKNQHYFDLSYENPNGPRAAAESGTRLDMELFKKLTSKGR